MGDAQAYFAFQYGCLDPVRAFEDGPGRPADGETDAVLPKFELKEFRRIAEAIDRLAASLAESQATERSLAQRLLTLQESERRELARELHDEFGQSLTIAILKKCSMRSVRSLRDAVSFLPILRKPWRAHRLIGIDFFALTTSAARME